MKRLLTGKRRFHFGGPTRARERPTYLRAEEKRREERNQKVREGLGKASERENLYECSSSWTSQWKH